MAVWLEITDGSSSAQITALATRGFDYLPRPPAVEPRAINDEYDGGEQPNTFYRNVTESVTLYFNTLTQMRTAEEAIQRLLDLARFRQGSRPGAKVYLQFAESPSATLWRSEILAGAPVATALNGFALTYAITRRFYWERATEIQLSMSNDVTGSTTAITLYNHNRNASSRNNYARITGVLGSMPAPVRFVLTNTYASATRVSDVYIGHMLDGSPAFSGQHVIEIESGTFYGSSAVRSNGIASGGQDGNLAWSGTSEAILWSGVIGATVLNAAGGGWFKVIAYSTQASSDQSTRVRARISIDLISELWAGAYTLFSPFAGTLTDLGNVQLPAGLVGGSAYPLTIELRARSPLVGTHNIYPDYIEFLPLRSFRFLDELGYGVAQGVALHDNPYEEQVFTSWGSGNIGNYTPLGAPIMLVPNRTNVIYLMVTPCDNVARSTQVQAWYRPRVLMP
jgi:hypothetical protein